MCEAAGVFLPYLVRGKFYITHAWRALGTDYAQSVPPAAWKQFYERLGKAKADLERAHALNPKDPHAAANLITVAMGLSLPRAQMETYFQQAIAADPTLHSAYTRKLEYLKPKWHGSHPDMLTFARQAFKEAPLEARTGSLLNETHWELGQNYRGYLQRPDVWQDIQAAFDRRLANQTATASILNFAAKYAVSCKQYDAACKYFSRLGVAYESAAWNDNFARFVNARAEAFHPGNSNGNPWAEGGLMAEFDWIINAATKELAANPQNANALLVRGVAIGLRRRSPAAERDFEAADKLKPNWAMLHYVWGRHCNDVTKDHEAAAAHFRTAMKLAPDNANVRVDLGVVLRNLKKYEEALELFEYGAKIKAHDLFALRNAVQACIELQQYERGLKYAREGLGHALHDPNKSWTKPFVDYVLWFDQKLERPRELLMDYQAAMQLLPNDSQYYNGVAWQLVRSKDESLRNPQLALAPAKKAVELTQSRKEPYLHTLAIVYEELKMTAEAQGQGSSFSSSSRSARWPRTLSSRCRA